MSGARVPHTLVIRRTKDLLTLERDIRALLLCQSRSCAFLQSAEYAQLKFDVCHSLRMPARGAARVLYIPNSTLSIHVSDDCLMLVIQSRSVAFVRPSGSMRKGTGLAEQIHAHEQLSQNNNNAPKRQRRFLEGEEARDDAQPQPCWQVYS